MSGKQSFTEADVEAWAFQLSQIEHGNPVVHGQMLPMPFKMDFIRTLAREVERKLSEKPLTPWFKCSDRLPEEKDGDCEGKVWVIWVNGFIDRIHFQLVGAHQTHWRPANLLKPEPPRE